MITLNDPGAAVGTVKLGVRLRRHGRSHLPLSAGRHARLGHHDRLRRDRAVRRHLDDGAAAERQYDLLALATDGGGNPGTSGRGRPVDRTQPTGTITAPSAGTIVGGPAVALTAAAADRRLRRRSSRAR